MINQVVSLGLAIVVLGAAAMLGQSCTSAVRDQQFSPIERSEKLNELASRAAAGHRIPE